jgi:hypothetical protein
MLNHVYPENGLKSRFRLTDLVGKHIIEPMIQSHCLEHFKQSGMVKLTWISLNKFIHSMLSGLVRIW